MVRVNSSFATTVTVPSDNTYNFPIGTQILIVQLGTGSVRINPATTPQQVTVFSEGSRFTTKARYATASLVKIAANQWLLFGNLTV